MANYSISRIFSIKQSRIVNSNEILCFPEEQLFKLRRELKEDRKGALLCAECYQPLILAGSSNQKLHFRHMPGSDDCPVKTTCTLTEEEKEIIRYNGEKEGARHKEYKALLANLLKADPAFGDVKIEKTFREAQTTGVASSWRRPDVQATRLPDSLKVALELQLSTTFIDVIIAREAFYRDNSAAIIWVFANFNNSSFTEKDIFYSSFSNAFVLDEDAMAKSESAGKLYLTCYYTDYELQESGYQVSIAEKRCAELVSVENLIWSKEKGKLYYKNVEQVKTQIKMTRNARQSELDKERQRIQEERTRRNFALSNPSYSRPPSLKEAAVKSLRQRGMLDKLKCDNCGNDSSFRSTGPFVLCNKCNTEFKY